MNSGASRLYDHSSPQHLNSARAFFDELNQRYLKLHRAEGDLYWATHTGQSDDRDALAAASLSRKMFMAGAMRLTETREHSARLHQADPSSERDALIRGLHGWVISQTRA